MYLRFVKAAIRPERAADFAKHYEERIKPELERTPGCMFAALMTSGKEPPEAVSMTIWDTRHDAERYERSGVYKSLVDEVRPFILGVDEWKMRLHDPDALLERPRATDPEVSAFPIQTGDPDQIPETPHSDHYYLRIVSLHVKTGELYRLINAYEEKIVPTLLGVDGCRNAFLARGNIDRDHALSITLWDSPDEAKAYEESGLFDELLEIVKPMLAETSEWKMALGPSGSTEPTADDLDVSGWQVVSSNEFATVSAER